MNKKRELEYHSAYLRMCFEWAKLSYSKRQKVGALIVKDNTIIGQGFNGTPPGTDNTCETFDGEKLVTKPDVIHAERNCILRVADSPHSTRGSTLYITHTPCYDCALLIRTANIKDIYFCQYYTSPSGNRSNCQHTPHEVIEQLRKWNVACTQIELE